MNDNMKKLLYWTPRILCILFAMFLSLFSFDVFNEGHGFLETILALFMHLIPVYIVLLVLAVAWRWEWVGAVLFIGMALFYLASTWGRFHWSAYVMISGTAALVGILFLINWIYREKLRLR